MCRLINPIFSHSIITEPGLSYLATGGGVAPALSAARLCTIYYASQQDAGARAQADLSPPSRYQALPPSTLGYRGWSKLLFLWDMIKAVLPYAQTLNCRVQEMRRRSQAVCWVGSWLRVSALRPPTLLPRDVIQTCLPGTAFSGGGGGGTLQDGLTSSVSPPMPSSSSFGSV